MSLVRADARLVPLRDETVDLVVTSPPYFGLRSYTDDGEHYEGQIGDEPSPTEFLEALWSVTEELVRVLKPSGSIFVNLGDKYAGTDGASGAVTAYNATTREARQTYRGSWDGIRSKSLVGIPWRYAIGAVDRLGLILRANIIWSKPNGLPESVTDRVRRSHEDWFHLVKSPRYFTGVDEIREPHTHEPNGAVFGGKKSVGADDLVGASKRRTGVNTYDTLNPLGKLPGSVWTIPTEPLRVPDHLPQHFAAFPSEWPRRLILGWAPSGICVECGQGRRPVVAKEQDAQGRTTNGPKSLARRSEAGGTNGAGRSVRTVESATITGYACDCPTPDAPTTPSIVLDPFCGTGTTVAVARALGRFGIGLDLSDDYLRLARWRVTDPKLRAKVLGTKPPKREFVGQISIFEEEA